MTLNDLLESVPGEPIVIVDGVGSTIQITQKIPVPSKATISIKDEIESWIIDEFKKVGLETAKSVLDKDTGALVNMTDLEEETIEDVKRILSEEFED
jgi:hypothetical protein